MSGSSDAEVGARQGPRARERQPLPLATVRGRAYPALLAGGLAAQVVGLIAGLPLIAGFGAAVGGLADLSTAGTPVTLRGQLRRAGLGTLQRTSVRAILLLAALAPELSLLAAGSYGLAVAAVIAVARADQVIARMVLADAPPLALRNLSVDPDHSDLYLRTQRRSTVGVNLFAGLEVPIALSVVAAATEAVAPLTVAILQTGVILAAVLVVGASAQRLLSFRRAGEQDRYLEALRELLRAQGAEYVVYFSGDPDATYQLNQWVDVFERIEEPVLYLLREHVHEQQMKPTRWPVIVCPKHADVEVALAADPKVALYVATAGRNIHFLRYNSMRHVFLNHGDSDKISSANPVVKVYDHLFVAGQMAIDRYRAARIDLPDDRFSIVGRPQLNGVETGGRRIGAGPPTVLYAPTWEGYFDSADYSSLERQGVELVEQLLAFDGDIRVVFKAHPMSGIVRPTAARAMKATEQLLRAAGEPHILANDYPDVDLLGWFDRSDILLADVSAVITDFLATRKPYIVTNPRGLSRKEFEHRFPSHTASYLIDRDGGKLQQMLAAALTGDPKAAARAARTEAVLGSHEFGPLHSFLDALQSVRARSIFDRELGAPRGSSAEE